MLRRFADLVVASDVALGDLPGAAGAPDITIRSGTRAAATWTPVQRWADDTGDWLTIERGTAEYRLRFPDLQCVVSADGSRIEYEAPPDLSQAELAHLLLHQVLPLAVSRRGRLVLHACAIETSHGAIGLLGESGAGKSTLAAAFCASGCRLVADDALVIDISAAGADAWPTADGLRLWEDMAATLPSGAAAPGEAGRKRRVRAQLATAPSPLRRLLVVGDASESGVSIDALPASETRVALLSHMFRLDITDAADSRQSFDLVHALAERVPVRRLKFRDGVEFLEPTVRAILRDLETP